MTLLTFATVYGFILGERITGAHERTAFVVEAQAEQWRWQFTRHTPAGSRTVVDRLDIPAGQAVEVAVTSIDVIHSFWAPRLGGKVDAIPGVTNRIIIRADRPGRYAGVCAEFCGIGHTGMNLTIVAHDPESWAAIESGSQP
ncbi:MAG: cytochrome C oxidase subunit II [Beijerinckiaceae bacterium]|nr:cytochrome C oxidase subunit II [Beijerinckiaceae bacterium]